MRKIKWQIAAVFALLPTVFGQLSPANAADSAPSLINAPAVTSSAEFIVGNALNLSEATWDGTPAPTVTNQWYSCANQSLVPADTLPVGCVAITGATANRFVLTNSQKGKFVLVGSFATNSQTGNTPVASYSATTGTAILASPALKPTVLGTNSTVKFTKSTTAALNSKYTVDTTTWLAATSYLYKWYRCDQAVEAGTTEPTGCDEITGATASSYVVTSSDVDKVITSFVTAKSGAVTSGTIRIASETVVMQTPVNASPSSVFAGTVAVGRTLTAIDGTWLASPSAAFTYQWYLCTAAVPAAAVKNAKCKAIAGATGSSLVVPATANNKFLVVQVKATNATNATSPVSSFSASSSKVLTAPTNTVQPKLVFSQTTATGQPVIGTTISVTPGTWTGNPLPTKSYQWYYCEGTVGSGVTNLPSGCIAIDGATGKSVTTTTAMQGKFIVAREYGSNIAETKSAFTASANSLQTKPLFDADPTLSGTADSTGSLTVTSGASAIGGQASETYAWAKCATPQVAGAGFPIGCTILAGEVSSTLNVDTSVEGFYLVARVTLTNAAGQTVRTSATSSQVTGPIANVSMAKPASTKGSVQLGVPVQASDGVWSGFPQPTFEYNWYLCSQPVLDKSVTVPDGCFAIGSANGKTYTPVLSDAANYLSVQVTAVGGSDRIAVWSPTTYQVLEAPSFIGDPSVGPQHVVGGANLVPDIGAIRGTSDPKIDYAWFRCSAPVAADSAALAVGCTAIGGANAASYAFTATDVGKYVLASITLTNELGTVKRYTASSQLVNIAPGNLTALAPVSATAPVRVGVQLTAGTTTWSGNPQPTIGRQWFRCDIPQLAKALDVPPTCSAIGGQILDTYVPTTADAGKFLVVATRGFNEHGSQTVYSPSTADVADVPRFNSGPILNSLRNKGDRLEVSISDTAGWPIPANTYRWFRCDSYVDGIGTAIPSGCVVIKGAITATYQLVAADIQKFVLVEMKLKNSVGEVTKYSASSLQILQLPEIAPGISITGNLWVDQTLTANGISVTGFPSPVTTVQWLRCSSISSDFSGCSVVATGTNTYKLKEADRGQQMVVRVSATNDAGVTNAASQPTLSINMAPKLVGLSPSVTGTDDGDNEARAATTLTAFEGLWDASPAINPQTGFKYQWYFCSLRHPISSPVIPQDCSLIKSQIAPTYLVKATDKEKYLGFSLKVSNGTQDVVQFSSTTERVYVVPTYMSGAKPAFGLNQAATDGSPRIGYDIEANVGTWQGSPTPTYTYQWFSCTQAVSAATVQLGDLCQIIVGETNRVLTIGPEQVNNFLGVMIRGSYKSYLDEIYSPTTAKSVVAPPINTVPPRITSRFTYVASTLKTTEGAWTGTPTPAQVHSWWECDEQILEATSIQPTSCRELPNSPGNWKVTGSQNGKYLVSMTTSSNSAGSARIWSASTDQITTGSVNINPPTIAVVAPRVAFTGSQFASTLVDLKISDAVAGDWVGTPTPDLTTNSYSWYRCADQVKDASDLLGNSCELIELNASSQTYRPVSDDVGKFLVGSVKNDNGVGASIVYTASTDAILTPPNNTNAPLITGKAFVDQPVNGDKGTWDGFPIPTWTTQWLACDGQLIASVTVVPSGCVAIDKATNATFSPTDDLLGKFLVFRVTATNKVGVQVVWSASTSAVVSGPVKKQDPRFTYPATTTTPVTSLNPIVGKPFTTDGGVWKGVPAPIKSYEWLSCPAALASSATAPTSDKNCELVPSVNSETITPNEGMRGRFLLVHVHATNENGEADFYSATTTVVWMAPVVDHPVAATGTAFHRLTLKAKLDTWKSYPDVTKAYQWYVCPTVVANYSTSLPNGCSTIAGATGSKFKIPDAATWPHTHEFLVVKIKATNAVDSSEHYSATSDEIQLGPVNEKSPTVSGTANFAPNSATTLSGNAGTWWPVDSSLSYQWYRCDAVLLASDELDPGCAPIAGAIGLNYQLADIDPGNSLMLAVTGTQGNLQSTSYSASTALVTEKARNVTPPSVAGVPRVNETSTGVDGDWRGYPTVIKTRTWYACTTKPLTAGSTLPATCKLLSGATAETLTNDADLIGKYLVYSVSGTNKVGTVTTKVTVYSAGTDAVADPPVFAEKPSVVRPAGTTADQAPTVGSVWNSKATFTNKIVPTLSYKWYRCVNLVDTATVTITSVPDGCEEISAATDASYTIRVDDRNKYILVGVTGRNAAGETTQFSNSTDYPIAQAPVADPLPSISGNHVSGAVLTINPGSWTPVDPAPTITYNWYSCSAPVPVTTTAQPPTTCINLSKSGITYKISDLDNGAYITAQVVGTSASGRSITSYFLAVTQGTSKAPALTTAPVVTGDAYLVGLVLTASRDEWDAMPAPTKTYQWYSCTSRVTASAANRADGCSEISGATDSTYQIGREHTGEYIMVRVTASNSAGDATIYSASTDVPIVAGYEPNNSVSVAAVGGNLKISTSTSVEFSQTTGTWTHGNDTTQPLTNHRWVFCSDPVSQPTSRFPSSCDFIYSYAGPQNKLDTREAQNLPLDFATYFAGYYITTVEYVLKPGSNPQYDTFSNRQAFRIAKSTDQVKIAPRIWDDSTVFTEPTVTAASMVGAQSTVNQIQAWQNDTDPFSLNPLAHVTWSGVEAGSFTYKWFTCVAKQTTMSKTALPNGCALIPGAESDTYTPSADDVREYLGVQITATNSSGSATIWTKTSEKVTQRPTVVVGSEPTLGNVTFTQDVATVNKGTWQGEPTPTFKYQWFLCAPSVSEPISTSTVPSDCTAIGSLTTDSSIVVPSLGGRNLDRKIAVQVIATNKPYLNDPTAVAETRTSASSGLLSEKPYYRLTTPVAMTSSPTTSTFAPNVGETITMTNDQSYWYGTPVESAGLTFTYSWYTCTLNYPNINRTDTLNSDCSQIPNETSNSLVLTHALAGLRVLGKITATSVQSGWSGYATTATTAQVAEKPYVQRIPSLTSSVGSQPIVNSKVIADAGDWGGFPTPTLDSGNLWWYSCDTAVTAGTSLKNGCVRIANAPSTTNYTPTSDLAGKYIVFSSAAQNRMNSSGAGVMTAEDRQYSAAFGPTLLAPEITFASPPFTGAPHVGQTLTTIMPTVKAYPAPTSTSFEWYSCPTSAGVDTVATISPNCVKIGETNQTSITVDDSMAGRFIEIYAVSTNSVKTVRKNTFSNKFVTKAPTNEIAPSISGTALADGTNTLTGKIGHWSATPSVASYGYTWYLCSTSNPAATALKPATCTDKVGSTTTAPVPITLLRSMAGKFVVLEETATQASNNFDVGKVTKAFYSASSSEILTKPQFDTASSFSGYIQVDEQLVADTGTFSGNPGPTPNIQWMACTSAVTSQTSVATSGCADIAGESNLRYTVSSSVLNRYITVAVTASSRIGSVTNYALSSSNYVTQAPSSTAPVSLRGDTTVGAGKSINVVEGTWSGTPQVNTSYKWYYCDTPKATPASTVGSDCTLAATSNGLAITTKNLPLTQEYRGKYIVVVETGTNASNKPSATTASVVSASLGPITMAPLFAATPQITGTFQVGQTLSATLPAVTEYPSVDSTYDWWSCSTAINGSVSNKPANCEVVASNADLQLTDSMAGKFIAVSVTNSNGIGTSSKSSTGLLDVTQSPVNTTAPVITGSAVVGASAPLAVTTGTWTSSPAATPSDFSYVWYQCSQAHTTSPDTLPADCAAISGQSASTLLPTNAMAGSYLLVKVTLTVRSNKSNAGTAADYSATTATSVLNAPQFGTGSPTISGIAHQGETLTATLTTVSGNLAPTSTYQWWTCTDALVAGKSDITASCSAISGSNDAPLIISSSLAGKRIALVQTAANAQGSVTKASATTAVVSATATISVSPAISGTDIMTATATAVVNSGTWLGSPTPVAGNFTYLWYFCSNPSSASNAIPSGCTSTALTTTTVNLNNAWVGKYLVAKVTATTATNKPGTESASTYSASFGPIRIAPSVATAPTFAPTAVIAGRTITANVGTWNGTGPISTTYKWYSCPATSTISAAVPIPSACAVISGFDSQSLVVPASAVGKKILLAVTATNSVGSKVSSAISGSAVAAASLSPLALRAIL